MIKNKLKEAEAYPYLGWFREQLKCTNIKVHKWSEWNDVETYEAFISSRRVHVPIPINEWSFLVALHELGHISTGERLYSYLQEYNAEKWAMRRAKTVYNIDCPDYEIDAKEYVYNHLIQDLLESDLTLKKVKSYVKEWLEVTDSDIANRILTLKNDNQIDSQIKVDMVYWNNIANGKDTNTKTRNTRKSGFFKRCIQFVIQQAKRA